MTVPGRRCWSDDCRFRRGAVLEAEKSVEVYVPEGFAIPGQDVIYSLSVTNSGTGPADANSIQIIDQVPDEVTVFTGTTPEFGNARAGWSAGTSGLTFDPLTDFGFSNATTAPTGFADCTYNPVAPYDPAITYVCARPQGAMNEGSPSPQFTVRFRARLD